MRRMRRTLGALLVIAFFAPVSHALTTRGAGILADGLALSVFGLSRNASVSPRDAPLGTLPSETKPSTPAGQDLSLAEGTATAPAPGIFPPAASGGGTTALPPGRFSGAASVPEPATFPLLLLGLIGLAAILRRSRPA
jgi:hypothetical protein